MGIVIVLAAASRAGNGRVRWRECGGFEKGDTAGASAGGGCTNIAGCGRSVDARDGRWEGATGDGGRARQVRADWSRAEAVTTGGETGASMCVKIRRRRRGSGSA